MESSTVNALHPDLFEKHQVWALRLARAEWRHLPPSFELKDLEQEALLALWLQSQRFDPARRVPFQAFAYGAIKGAIVMSCRRKHYREATHEELQAKDEPVDARPNAEQALLESREQKLRNQRKSYRLQKVQDLMVGLSAADAFLVKRAFISGVSLEKLAELWSMPADRMRRRLNNAVRVLRKASKHSRRVTPKRQRSFTSKYKASRRPGLSGQRVKTTDEHDKSSEVSSN